MEDVTNLVVSRIQASFVEIEPSKSVAAYNVEVDAFSSEDSLRRSSARLSE